MALSVSGSTTVVGVIGSPIAHSLSPAIHNAAFEELGLDWICVAFATPEGQAGHAVAGMRAMGIRGLSVTMPHKAAVIPYLDRLTPDAARLGAVNCISSVRGALVGDSTDGVGFVHSLAKEFDFYPEGRSAVVVGAGGAARSVILSLTRAGASSVKVVNRSESRAAAAANLAGAVGIVGSADDIATADLVVNATPVGMTRRTGGGHDTPFDTSLLSDGQIVADLVYHPLETELIRQAEARGCRVSNGVSMLVLQAAVAFETWTGEIAPLDAMFAAVESRLG